ncbi:MAG: DNA-processing protein DprA [Actinomycetota bacterium]
MSAGAVPDASDALGAHINHDERVVAAAIAALPGIGPQRLRTFIGALGVMSTWHVVRGEVRAPAHLAAVLQHDNLHHVVRRAATSQLLDQMAESLHAGNIRVLLACDAEYPASLRDDFAAPAVLFARGNLAAFANRRVGIIGTRAASAAGRHFARQLGRDLAQNGVSVVSGLARGIDAAAHRGVISRNADDDDIQRDATTTTGAPIAVVASGLDVVYPREHAALWQHVAERGVIIGESPPGCAPDAFRFPLRNRILAAVSEILVVVESRATGGSMITVDEAARRGVTVMAVPGSPHSETSAGTNALISDGAATVCDATDVMVALGLDHHRHAASSDARTRPLPADRVVLDALARRPMTFEQIVAEVNLPLQDVAMSLGRLDAQGWAVVNGGWWEALLAMRAATTV